jgi:hypothetical protein
MSPYDPQDFVPSPPPEDTESGTFEIKIKVQGAHKVNRLLSWIVRSRAYDDVTSLTVAFEGDRQAESQAS